LKNYITEILSEDDIKQIVAHIGEKEKTTSGEIKISFRKKRGLFEQSMPIEKLAVKEFNKLKLYKTVDRTGILIFVVFKSREFYIMGDSGINTKLPDDFWNNVKVQMQNDFKTGKFREGFITALDSIGIALSEHFPIKPGDTNEISNEININ